MPIKRLHRSRVVVVQTVNVIANCVWLQTHVAIYLIRNVEIKRSELLQQTASPGQSHDPGSRRVESAFSIVYLKRHSLRRLQHRLTVFVYNLLCGAHTTSSAAFRHLFVLRVSLCLGE